MKKNLNYIYHAVPYHFCKDMLFSTFCDLWKVQIYCIKQLLSFKIKYVADVYSNMVRCFFPPAYCQSHH